MGVTDVQVTGATLPVGVPELPGLGESGGNGVPVTEPEGEAGLPLGARGLPVTVGLPEAEDSVGLGVGWFPPLCNMPQPLRVTAVINKPGTINVVAREGRLLRSNVVVGMTRA